jgi:hypothetical protein
VAIAVSFAAVGVVVARRGPANPTGWLMICPAACAVAAAALFSPLRRRVQQLVDRRFNRARYDADQTISAFAARLQDAVDLEAARADLLAAVDQALEPAHASVRIGPLDRQR